MTTEAFPLLVSFEQAAALLGISRALLYNLHSDGRLGPMVHKIGRRSLLVRAELEAWVEAGLPPRHVWLRQATDKPGVKTAVLGHKHNKPTDS